MCSIYTGRGDNGETSLSDGQRRPKDDPRLEAYGSLDEVNSLLGFARSIAEDPLVDDLLEFAQHRLSNCCGALASPAGGDSGVSDEDITVLEAAIDSFEAETGPLRSFVLQAGDELACRLHVARTACRRAERRMVTLNTREPVQRPVLSFVNRLSDALFAAARYANKSADIAEQTWDADFPRPTF